MPKEDPKTLILTFLPILNPHPRASITSESSLIPTSVSNATPRFRSKRETCALIRLTPASAPNSAPTQAPARAWKAEKLVFAYAGMPGFPGNLNTVASASALTCTMIPSSFPARAPRYRTCSGRISIKIDSLICVFCEVSFSEIYKVFAEEKGFIFESLSQR